MKRTCHKGVVLGHIGKHDQFGTAYRVAIGGKFSCFFDYFARFAHGFHIDAGFGGGNIHRRADLARLRKRIRYRLDKPSFALGASLLHQRTVASDKVYAERVGGTVKRFCDLYIIL